MSATTAAVSAPKQHFRAARALWVIGPGMMVMIADTDAGRTLVRTASRRPRLPDAGGSEPRRRRESSHPCPRDRRCRASGEPRGIAGRLVGGRGGIRITPQLERRSAARPTLLRHLCRGIGSAHPDAGIRVQPARHSAGRSCRTPGTRQREHLPKRCEKQSEHLRILLVLLVPRLALGFVEISRGTRWPPCSHARARASTSSTS
jgi:hypothetical protein